MQTRPRTPRLLRTALGPALFIFVGCGALLCGTARLAAQDGSEYTFAFRRGDANASGSVDLSDAVFTFRWLFQQGETPTCLDATDTNDDGSVDISDGVFTLGYLFRAGDVVPPPGAESCGRDPSLDDLGCESYQPCVCGGLLGSPCDEGQFCDQRPGLCQVADVTGTCVPVPDGCPRILDPVCGCDGVTYANDCERLRAGVQKAYHGECREGIEFKTLALGLSSGAEPDTRVILDEDAWTEFWDAHGSISVPPPSRPEIDFRTQMVVVVLEEHTSGGHHLQIDALSVVADVLHIAATRVVPSGDCPTTDNITQPHHFVVAERFDGRFEADVTENAVCCDMPLDARGVGACEAYFGVTWDGDECVGVSGCDCEGEDCDELFSSVEECRAAYHGCPILIAAPFPEELPEEDEALRAETDS